MKKDEYFNRIEFEKLLKLIKLNPFQAVHNFYEYIERYPKDYNVYPHFIGVLISQGRIEEAMSIFEEAKALADGNNRFKYSTGKYSYFFVNMILAKIKLLGYLERYDELLGLYMENIDLIKDRQIDLGILNFYCKTKLGIPPKTFEKDDSYHYMYEQIQNYSEDVFLEHVKKHMADYTQTPQDCVFAPDFPIIKIIDEIKKILPNEKGIFVGYFDDSYIFKFDNCGRAKKHLVDYFKIVCFHNTNKFITMYPVYGYENWDYIDLNYLKEEKKPKIKKQSRIDKFYQKYGQ